jgi:hypothetical protein
MFTTDTETGEIACVLHLKIPNVPNCGRDTGKKEVRDDQEKEEVVDLPSLAQALGGHPRTSRMGAPARVYLDNARYTEGILDSLQKWWIIDRSGLPGRLRSPSCPGTGRWWVPSTGQIRKSR